MADLTQFDFDANAVEPTSFDVVPAGEYEACVVSSEMVTTSKGGQMLKLTLQVLNGPCQNRMVFDNLNLINDNDKAVQIAKGTLSAICRAVGVMTPKDSAELHDRPLRIKVAVRPPQGEYPESNVVKAYKPRHASGPAPVVTSPAASQPVNSGQGPW